MSIYRGFQIVVTPALRDADEGPAIQRVLERRFPGCIVEFAAADSLHGRLAVYATPAMKEATAVDPNSGKPVATKMPAIHMLVAESLKEWGIWY